MQRLLTFMLPLIILTTVTIAHAQVLITPDITSNSSVYTYSYILKNIGSTSILAFGLEIPVSNVDVTAPLGWTSAVTPDGSNTQILWASSDVPFDLPPTSDLSGFLVTSTSPPDNVDYTVLDENFDSFDGRTIGPSVPPSVPESNLTTTLITGMTISFLCTAKRRQKRSKR